MEDQPPPDPPGSRELARLRSLRQQEASAKGRIAATDTEIEYHTELLANLYKDHAYWSHVSAKLRGSIAVAEEAVDEHFNPDSV